MLRAGAVARRLGVAVATLRSWDRRYGLGAHQVSPGGHRRYTAVDMARLEYMCVLVADGVPAIEAARAAREFTPPSVAGRDAGPSRRGHLKPLVPEQPISEPSTSLPAPNLEQVGRGLARAAMRLDSDTVLAVLEREFAARGVVRAWEDIARPVLYGMGRKWESGVRAAVVARYVEVEHLLSECVSTALRRAYPSPSGGPRPKSGGRGVLLACTETELHTLPLEALAAALGERRVPVRMFGAALPGEALLRAVRRTGPAAVVLWSHTRETADPRLVAALLKLPALRVCAAGPGWSNTAAMRGSSLLSSLPQALAVLTSPGLPDRAGNRT